MILCVNVNSALDRVLIGECFVPGGTMRVEKVLDCIGGKAADAALVLRTLDAPHLLVSFMAGETGQSLERILNSRGIQNHLIWVAGETRIAYVIAERASQRHTHVTTSGYAVSSTDSAVFLEQVRRFATQANWVLMAGSLPPGMSEDFYARVIEAAHHSGAKTLIDAFGVVLRSALPVKPDVVKLNRDEFAETFAVRVGSLDELAFQTRVRLLEPYGLSNVVITLGEDGILAVGGSEAWHARPPKLIAINAAGAGDAATAAIAYRLSLGEPWPTVLQWAGATSAASVLTEGTAECECMEIKKLFPHVHVNRLS